MSPMFTSFLRQSESRETGEHGGTSRFYFLIVGDGTGMTPASNAANVRFSSSISLFSAVISGPIGFMVPVSTFFLTTPQLLF